MIKHHLYPQHPSQVDPIRGSADPKAANQGMVPCDQSMMLMDG